MPPTRRGTYARHVYSDKPFLLVYSPLKPAELQVLQAQYEKEGQYVGIQTKFNYAWVHFFLLRIQIGQHTDAHRQS